ncbi:MAG: hypothetical protein ABIR32_13045 [Ilumatobacteraceae bacterium]
MSTSHPQIDWKIDWNVHHSRGDAAEFHGRQIPDDLEPSVWWFEVDRPAIVLGSAQPLEHLDLVACERARVEVVRRRSGGGAVLVAPGDVVWVDVLIPTTHHQWTNDVTSSAWWLGEVWRRTLVDLGVAHGEVHVGSMVTTPWSSRVCFAGIGGGEVVTKEVVTMEVVTKAAGASTAATSTAATSKIVGISQRRTRAAARFQCALYRHWRPIETSALFAKPIPPSSELDNAVTTVDADDASIELAFLNQLRQG